MKTLFSRRLRILLKLLFIILLLPCGFSQSYSVKDIPETLLEDTDLIVRKHVTRFEVISIGEGRKKVTRVITLLNSNARNHRTFAVGYDDMRNIKSIGLKVYDRNGNLIEKYKAKDFDDISSYDGFSVFSDNRLKLLSVPNDNYPFTVEFEYEVFYKGLMFYPEQTFNSSHSTVEYSSFSAKIPSDLELRYKLQNSKEPEITSFDGYNEYKWVYENLSKVTKEPYSPSLREQLISVDTSPNEFEFGGFQGNMETWNGLAEFQRKLSSELDPLPKETAVKISELTKDVKITEEKIDIVYNHLQNNFRYVSVQLGIGGWQPFSPAFVDEIGYGDCKALSFYTKAMLESIGITANYTLISAGTSFEPLDPAFPTSNFNHVILSIPNQTDTIWLECTSQNSPMGYNGYFTGNRKALMITETEGIVVETPKYAMNDNKQIRNCSAKIDREGMMTLNLSTKYTGLQYENDDLNFILNQSKEDQKEWLYETIDLPDFTIKDFKFNLKKLKTPEALVEAKLQSGQVASKSGNRIFLEANLFNKLSSIPPEIENRTTDVMLNIPYLDLDSIWFEMPTNSTIEFLPKNQNISSPFGEYSTNYTIENGNVLYIRKIAMDKGRFPKEKYDEFRAFRSAIYEADRRKMIIKLEN